MKLAVSMIVAIATNRCIGADNRIPWHLPEDLRHFKRATLGHPVIMGRKTFESILASLGHPLPGRTSIIVTREPEYRIDRVTPAQRQSLLLADSPLTALEAAESTGAKEAFVIGGAQIYAAMMPATRRLLVTEIAENFTGNAFFPVIDPELWREVARTIPARGGTPEVTYTIVEYHRRIST